MQKRTQREENPFPFSDSNKRYHTYEYYLRRAFGGKCVKIPLNGGFTCPNRDGRCGYGGCIFCSGQGSGDFALSPDLSLAEQYRAEREKLSAKWDTARCIPYFQPFTNTYAPVERLRTLWNEALALPDVVGMNVATRADCLPDDVVDLLAEFSERTVLTLELGLQTIHDKTAKAIGRGYPLSVFADAWARLREKAPCVRLGVHLIFGLIGENDEMIGQTVQYVARLSPEEVKFHSLYVVKNTKMAQIYENGGYFPLSRDQYTDLVVCAIEHLPPQTVVARLTGDSAETELLAPLWGLKKREILNEIDKKFYARKTYQGKLYSL